MSTLVVMTASRQVRGNMLRLLNTCELFASSGPSPPATSASGHATAVPASTVPELGFLPINGHVNDNRSVVSMAQSIVMTAGEIIPE